MSRDDRSPSRRVLAVDWLRGVVMALMVLDHAGAFFDSKHLMVDSAALLARWREASPLDALPWDRLLVRWVTHFCAPAFVLTSGIAVVLSASRRRAEGVSDGRIDARLVGRGAVLLLLEATIVSATWWLGSGDREFVLILQVLWVIGLGLIAAPLLRRTPTPLLLLGAVLWIAASEAVTDALWDGTSWEGPWPTALLLTVKAWSSERFGVTVIYPAVPWLAVFVLGLVVGRSLRDETTAARARWPLAASGAALLATFVVLRVLDGYGNLGVSREPADAWSWLLVSKYPPSIAFLALTLGGVLLALAGLGGLDGRRTRHRRTVDPFVIFGQVPLFFYLVHAPLLVLLAHATGRLRAGELSDAALATAATLAVLYPVCAVYRRLKLSHRHRWTALL